MKINIYTIFDSASGAYMRPFFAQSDGQATRSFGDIARDENHEIGKHPEDYSLYRVGIFDDNKAEITPEDKTCLATAMELIAIQKADQKPQLKEVN